MAQSTFEVQIPIKTSMRLVRMFSSSKPRKISYEPSEDVDKIIINGVSNLFAKLPENIGCYQSSHIENDNVVVKILLYSFTDGLKQFLDNAPSIVIKLLNPYYHDTMVTLWIVDENEIERMENYDEDFEFTYKLL